MTGLTREALARQSQADQAGPRRCPLGRDDVERVWSTSEHIKFTDLCSKKDN
jgi:hypothetical protein